ncbi:hypothetical protein [Vibrio mimicus]|uniref:hypothetical protein n=1 Tax=Vibrio mimicus TaxID=674 RepID=UPI00022890AD|nr:hypothetical protein SX4_1171 [Vibrio mimicus SX-4]
MTNPWVFPVPCPLPADELTLRYEQISASPVFYFCFISSQETAKQINKINYLHKNWIQNLQINT